MASKTCKGICVSHFGFTKRYSQDKTLEGARRYNRERMRAWRKGIKAPGKPSYETHNYCKICKVWIGKYEEYSKCPCCFSMLKGIVIPSVTIKEAFKAGYLMSKDVLIIYLAIAYFLMFALWFTGS